MHVDSVPEHQETFLGAPFGAMEGFAHSSAQFLCCTSHQGLVGAISSSTVYVPEDVTFLTFCHDSLQGPDSEQLWFQQYDISVVLRP